MTGRAIFWAKICLFAIALIPAIELGIGVAKDSLGPNPVETLTHESGQWGLRLMLLTLALTPIRHITGWNSVIRFRRMLGLFAFFYVTVHLSVYVVFDHYFAVADIIEDIAKRPYITIGFAAFVCLVPLAMTSTNWAIKRLGGSRWRKLHRLTYVAALLGVAHFLWLVKKDLREPLIYLGILLVLFAVRFFNRRRRARTPSQPKPAATGQSEAPIRS
ncbi:MAG: protein-methionine-sulfoxide reductase heme-binding subunit MsrQ [Pseudomonadota bacterium]